MSGTRKKLSVVLLALVVSAALTGSVLAEAAGAKSAPAIDGAASSSPKQGQGTVEREGKTYIVCVPYWAKNQAHHFILTKSGKTVDQFDFTVPVSAGKTTVETEDGVEIEIETIHTGGVNGSPSRGCFDYVLKVTVKKKGKK